MLIFQCEKYYHTDSSCLFSLYMISKTAISHLMYWLKYKSLFTFFHELVKVGRHKSYLIDKKEQSTCQHKMQLQMITKLAYKLFYVGSYITEQLISWFSPHEYTTTKEMWIKKPPRTHVLDGLYKRFLKCSHMCGTCVL